MSSKYLFLSLKSSLASLLPKNFATPSSKMDFPEPLPPIIVFNLSDKYGGCKEMKK